jgi:hypothetical protein
MKCPPYNKEGSRYDPIADVYPQAGEMAKDGKDGEPKDDVAGGAGETSSS